MGEENKLISEIYVQHEPNTQPDGPFLFSVKGENVFIENKNLIDFLKTKQDKLTPGDNITISADGVISASGGGVSIVIDSELSAESENPVQNKVINEALEVKLDRYTNKGGRRVYGVRRSDGEREMIQVMDTVFLGNIVNMLPQYYDKTSTQNYGSSPLTDTKGVLLTNEPNQPYQCANKDYVDKKFNGANKAVSFVNYSAMITSLNSLENTSYNVGQDIMIITLGVPDLWVSEIAEESVAYTYVSDTDFVNELTTNGSIQVGYYKLGALETQKVDLNGYIKNTDYAKAGWTGTGGIISFYTNPLSSGIKRYAEGDIVFPFINPADTTTLNSRDSTFLTPLIPKHINAIVKRALTGEKRIGQGTVGTDAWAIAEFTNEEKAQACEVLGIKGAKLYEHTLTFSNEINDYVRFSILSATSTAFSTLEELIDFGKSQCEILAYTYITSSGSDEYKIIVSWIPYTIDFSDGTSFSPTSVDDTVMEIE